MITQEKSKIGKVKRPLINGHSQTIQDLQFAPFYDNILATSSSDKLIKLWVLDEYSLSKDMNIGDELITLTGHKNLVSNI